MCFGQSVFESGSCKFIYSGVKFEGARQVNNKMLNCDGGYAIQHRLTFPTICNKARQPETYLNIIQSLRAFRRAKNQGSLSCEMGREGRGKKEEGRGIWGREYILSAQIGPNIASSWFNLLSSWLNLLPGWLKLASSWFKEATWRAKRAQVAAKTA